MTVKQLKKLLERFPDRHQVVLQKDSEGNGYSPLDGGDVMLYEAHNTWSGDAYNADDEDAPDEAKPCVVLWPVN